MKTTLHEIVRGLRACHANINGGVAGGFPLPSDLLTGQESGLGVPPSGGQAIPGSGRVSCSNVRPAKAGTPNLLLGLGLSVALLWGGAGRAALNIPSDGSDGELIVSNNLTINLAEAVTGVWSNDNSTNTGKGIYDPEKWAVVFKYASVTVSNGATLTFANHPSRAPVVWLVNGNVTINGTVSLNGQDYEGIPYLAEPGPGGFRGGTGRYISSIAASAGFGPGGGNRQPGTMGYAGSYGSSGWGGSTSYGNPSLLPLIGGSGGGGEDENFNGAWNISGGAGGGAILIACADTLTVGGAVTANGGAGYQDHGRESGGGSGGGIRLVADTLRGGGQIKAIGGGKSYYGGQGRIRIERATNASSLVITPDQPSVVPLEEGATPLIWLPDDGPRVRIVSIGNQVPPADPRAAFGAQGADVTLPQASSSQVEIETTNVEQASAVRVRVTPRANGNFTETWASTNWVVSTNPLVVRWIANVPVNSGYSAVQVRVVRP